MNELPKRKQTRLKNYNYSQNGYYFVTVCTHNKQQILSYICRGVCLLRRIGKIAEIQINELSAKYEIEIDPYVIMPDHVHMIIKINSNDKSAEQVYSPTISDIVCAFKSMTTKTANKKDNCFGRKIWQRNYYEHIIRNENDYTQTVKYILNNPLKWENEKKQ